MSQTLRIADCVAVRRGAIVVLDSKRRIVISPVEARFYTRLIGRDQQHSSPATFFNFALIFYSQPGATGT
jgi:hypothetical protein